MRFPSVQILHTDPSKVATLCVEHTHTVLTL